MMIKGFSIACFLFLGLFVQVIDSQAEDGYDLWLRYKLVSNPARLAEYRNNLKYIVINDKSPVIDAAIEELVNGVKGLTENKLEISSRIEKGGAVILKISKPENVTEPRLYNNLKMIGEEGYIISTEEEKKIKTIKISATTDKGLLYGVFHLLRILQTEKSIENLDIVSCPKAKHRLLNHWDNLDRTVERGYAGFSIWDWHKLPDYISPRYKDYARANASVGINGTVLTNVNANAFVLTPQYLEKAAALSNVFRPYGIRVYLTARFNSPMEIGGLKTADPLDADVQKWWADKADEIYKYIPDFGGFLVKANSEGQPGPNDYGRTHAEGANMLARALAPHGGVVIWRAFVYSNEAPDDRAKQANNEFVPLDGKFDDNVILQVKNGAIDFQPREPFHPLFGAVPHTNLMMEFQITQEYLGFATHLVYLAPLYKECLYSDTYAKGKGSYVAGVVDGSLFKNEHSGFSGVSNIGTDRNWTGSHFAQSNWYAFGRLAWDNSLMPADIAEEWTRMTFSNDSNVVSTIKEIMMASREITVSYMTPLGLHHIMGSNHHYGPGPWVDGGRPDWTSVNYHKADKLGIGFNRTETGSNAISQYFPEVQTMFSDPNLCPDKYLLWFHHLSWDFKMKSGNTLWEEMCFKYYRGADSVKWIRNQWKSLDGKIDPERFADVDAFLGIQQKEAIWWRNACVLYFQSFSRRSIPEGLEQPSGTLMEYEKMNFPYAPGIKPSW